jgi:hypothetical protein
VSPRTGLDRYRKARPPPGFGARTFQPVASRYTDYSIPAFAHVWVQRKVSLHTITITEFFRNATDVVGEELLL